MAFSSTTLRLFTVDAFADGPFSGNPAAVALLEKEYDEEIYQKIASEMNLSETSFVIPENKSQNFEQATKFKLRWFTPTAEVALCGHATLATAHVIFNSLNNKNASLSFTTKSGDLICTRKGDLIGMDFPQYHAKPVTKATHPSLFDGEKHVEWFQNLVSETHFARKEPGRKFLMAGLWLRSFHQKFPPGLLRAKRVIQVKRVGELIKGVCVTLKGTPSNGCMTGGSGRLYDFVSRYFAPWVGIPEDPATGSAHCALGPYWASLLKKSELRARQCSKRGANFQLSVQGTSRIQIFGKGIVILEGKFTF